jgi:hypothetical protein
VTTSEAAGIRRPRARRSFALSMLAAGARGTGLIAIAVAIGVVLLQYSDDTGERRVGGREPAGVAPVAQPSTSSTTTTSGVRPPGEVTVLVLNASGRAKQAGPMSERLQVVGYRTLEPGNASVRRESSVLCRAGFEREGTALEAATGLSAQVGELPADSGLPGAGEADCVVVIGSG